MIAGADLASGLVLFFFWILIEIKEWILFIFFSFRQDLQDYQDFLFRTHFPDENEYTQSAFSGN